MNQIVSFRLCTLTDDELIEAVDKATDKMFTDGKVPSLAVPAKPNEHYDLLVGELMVRFKERLESAEIKQKDLLKEYTDWLNRKSDWVKINPKLIEEFLAYKDYINKKTKECSE